MQLLLQVNLSTIHLHSLSLSHLTSSYTGIRYSHYLLHYLLHWLFTTTTNIFLLYYTRISNIWYLHYPTSNSFPILLNPTKSPLIQHLKSLDLGWSTTYPFIYTFIYSLIIHTACILVISWHFLTICHFLRFK